MRMRFERRELAGSLADLGTLLPLALGMVYLNGLDGTAIFLTVGAFYLLAGVYFGVTVPVQPMKVIGAYAIGSALSPQQISASCLWMSVFLLVLGLTGLLNAVNRIVPKSVVRGVQVVTGVMLVAQGVRFMLGRTELQRLHESAEPYLMLDAIGPIPIGIVLGGIAILLILFLVDNRFAPAALVVLLGGASVGLLLGGWRHLDDLTIGVHFVKWLPFGWPSATDVVLGLTALALPQLPMTVGNAAIAQSDLTREYFGEPAAKRSSPRALVTSMGLANLITGLVGGMPLCHGAGGLAAHYRFGARTSGSNFMIGLLFVTIGILLGSSGWVLFALLPFGVLGALLCFAGLQLALVLGDMSARGDLFVIIAMLATSLVLNLAVGFGVGMVVALLLRSPRFKI